MFPANSNSESSFGGAFTFGQSQATSAFKLQKPTADSRILPAKAAQALTASLALDSSSSSTAPSASPSNAAVSPILVGSTSATHTPKEPSTVTTSDLRDPEKINTILALLAEIGHTGLKAEDLGKLNPPDEYETELQVMAEVRGYFQVSYKVRTCSAHVQNIN